MADHGPITARPRRRPAARLAVAALAVLLLGALAAACGGERPGEGAGEVRAGGSTLDSRLVDREGDGVLRRGPGEPLRDRTDLAPAVAPRRVLASFGQLSDTHVRDEESPARVPFLARLGRPFTSAFRPHEALSAQVMADAVSALDAERPDAVVVTGDIIDNAQHNELEQAIGVLAGGRVDPGSGARGYDGVQAADNADPLFYRPDVDAPRHPGLLDRAQRPFVSPGLRAPWYPVLGNHDILVQGEVARTEAIDAVATGARRVTRIDPRDIDVPELRGRAQPDSIGPETVDRLLAGGLPGESEATPADPGRRTLAPEQVVERLRAAGAGGGGGSRLDYAFDIGPRVRGIVLDAVRRDRGSAGTLTPGQLDWLDRELARAGRRSVVVFAHQPLTSFAEGRAALERLDRHPRTAAVITGSIHRNQVRSRRTAGGGGYWLVTTASVVDFPQQSRMLRLVEGEDGRLALEAWMVDHAAASDLTRAARELAHLDAQGGRPQGAEGRAGDRNVRLALP